MKGTITAELQHVGYTADREPATREIAKNGKIYTWSDQ